MTVPEEAWEKTLRERREEEEEKIEAAKLEAFRKFKTYLAANILVTGSLKPNATNKAGDTGKDCGIKEDLESASPVATAAATAAGEKIHVEDHLLRNSNLVENLKPIVKSLVIPSVSLKMKH